MFEDGGIVEIAQLVRQFVRGGPVFPKPPAEGERFVVHHDRTSAPSQDEVKEWIVVTKRDKPAEGQLLRLPWGRAVPFVKIALASIDRAEQQVPDDLVAEIDSFLSADEED